MNGWLATRSAWREGWWRLATVFRTFFDPDYARSAQK